MVNDWIAVVVFILLVVVAIIYNTLTKARNKVKEKYSNIDVSLKKRWDIVPNLVEVVKGYSAYEEKTLEKLTELRSQQYDKFLMEQKLDIDNNISKVVSKIFAIAENYPELKANEEYLEFSKNLSNLEEEISKNREEYNKAVQEYNTKIEKIPNNIIAILFGFNEEKLFETQKNERKSFKVDL